KDDYLKAAEHLTLLHRKFATGVYAIWYPIADPARTDALLKRVRNSGVRRVLRLEVGLTHDHDQPGMTGTGMLVVNPPWNLAEVMKPALEWLASRLGDGAYAQVEELVGE